MHGESTHVIGPLENFLYLLNNIVVGESTIEDFILLVGTLVAFIAFVLWCCFPVQPKDTPLPVLQGLGKTWKDEDKYNQLLMECDMAT
ncbi:hypothetical protein NQ317_002216 [Molorchus minor]|uniref:Uncharacterized protein n=1 Tax=Molorchus minor TaxID=1323400 RepID=A0ABQ9JQD7_9CUCU|nr:hypothetical protein NQ317_002216 [Molorchus minor]